MADRTAAVKLTLRNEGFVAGLREARTQTNDFANSVQEGAKKNKGSLDTVAQGFGAVGLAAGGVFVAAVAKFADFDQAMSGVQAATHETAGNMEALREAALQAGKDTAFSATEAATGIQELAKAGVSTKDILGGGLKGALDLASAGSLNVGDAAEIAATALTQFKLSGADVPHVADLLAAAAGKAQGEVTDVAMALKQGGLVAAQFGLSIEETTGTIAAFASAGLIGSDAGTSFKTMLLALANPSAKAANTMKDLGIAAYDTKGNFVGIAPLAEELKTKLSGLAPAQRDAALATIFGSDAIRAANVLYQQGAAGISDWTTKVNDQGFAAETAALKTDNLKGDIERLGGALDTALIQGGAGANDALRALVKGADDAVSAFADLPDWVQQGAVALLGLVGAGALGAGGLVKAVQGATQLREALQKVNQISGALKFGLGGFGLALTAATVVFGAFAKESAESKQHIQEFRDTLDQTTGAITGNTRAYVANELAQSGLAQKAKDLGLNLSTVTDAALGNTGALDQVVGSLDKIAEANIIANSGIQSGVVRYTEQGEAAKALKAEILGQSDALGKATNQQKLAAEGAQENKSAQELTAEATKAASEAFQQEAQSLSDLIEQMHAASGAALDLSGAQISFQAAIDDATKGIKENGRTLDITTEKGRANKTNLDEIAASANKQTDAMLKSGVANETVAKSATSARATFSQVAQQMGLNKRQADALAKSLIDIPPKADTKVTNNAPAAKAKVDPYVQSLGLLPKTKTTGVYVTGAPAARQQVLNLSGAINNLPSVKNIYIKMIQSGSVGGIPAGIKAPGSAGGGLIPGAPSNVDNHLRPMATGEFVVQASQVPGNLAVLEAINSGRFQQTSRNFAGAVAAQASASAPIYVDNHIEIGGEVVRVVRTEIKADNRDLKRRVTQGRTT